MCVCVFLLKEISGRQMIPLSDITADGNSNEINTSVFGQRLKEMKDWTNHKMSLVSPSLLQPVSQLITLKALPRAASVKPLVW